MISELTKEQQELIGLPSTRPQRHSNLAARILLHFHEVSFIKKKTIPKNPALELEKLGMVAIPQLINHLDDPRPLVVWGIGGSTPVRATTCYATVIAVSNFLKQSRGTLSMKGKQQ